MIALMTAPLAAIGRSVLGFLALVGRVAIFAGQSIGHIFRPPITHENSCQQ